MTEVVENQDSYLRDMPESFLHIVECHLLYGTSPELVHIPEAGCDRPDCYHWGVQPPDDDRQSFPQNNFQGAAAIDRWDLELVRGWVSPRTTR